MKINSDYILKKVMGNYMIVSLNDSVAQTISMQTINETGAFIWGLLENGADTETICEKMILEYDVDKETALKDINAFLDKLDKAGVLDK